ncbi:MAG: hypothetical protein E7012_02380 [Alphaproteobacteria bacterium]|nr:hypothetical protein [Alphaproteobacteria bacterium]
MITTKKLSLSTLLKNSFSYCNEKYKILLLFMVANYLICSGAAYLWKSFWLWILVVILYVLWGGMFRYYFERKPYFDFKSLFYSMVPSTKIVVLSVMIVSIFLLLPLAILFIPFLPDEFINGYALFLQKNLQDTYLIDAMINVIVVIFSPIILYRPMLAWVAALLGRSGSLRFAWNKTGGNYWEFLLLAVLIDLLYALIYNGILILGGNIYVALMPISVLVVYFNIVIAKIYEFFFLE